MTFFKTQYITNKFNVSTTTVYNWIKGAINNENLLKLEKVKDKYYVINSEANLFEMKRLSDQGRKNKPRFNSVKLTANPDFYNIFTPTQVIEIIHDLNNYNEIQHKFTYLGIGAKRWGQYVEDTVNKKISVGTTNTTKALETVNQFLQNKLSDSKINIFDIGLGDCFPVKNYLNSLIQRNSLNAYIGLDISQDIINMGLANIKKWFGDSIEVDSQSVDIAGSHFREILAKHEDQGRNVVLFLGFTIENLRNKIETLLNIKNSMNNSDILVVTYSLDIDSSKPIRFPDLKDSPDEKLGLKKRWIPELLGIMPSMYDVLDEYNYESRERRKYIIFNHDIEIEFNTNLGIKNVYFRAGDKLLIWRHTHHLLHELIKDLDDFGFNIDASITSDDREEVTLVLSMKSKI